ncbi:MAG: diaminopimelate decarboxylase [Burkholderiales bacterium]
MTEFAFRSGVLYAEDVSLVTIAERYGTPCFVYSKAALVQAYTAFTTACAGRDTLVCYAMKANSNLAVLNVFARLGAGFDIVSEGELARVIAAGGDPTKVVFSGVGKTAAAMRAALAANILCFNVESESELKRLEGVAAEVGKRARISLRVNPDVDARTHPYISTGLRENKFGVPFETALALYRWAAASKHLDVVGIDCHIGSQITEVAPFVEALDRVLGLIDQLGGEGIRIHHLDVGGGLGIRYAEETPPSIGAYIHALFARIGTRSLKILFEPGRVLVGNAGMLLSRVEYVKATDERNFAIVDAAMNDLLRPSLYDAFHDIVAVSPGARSEGRYEIVGPVCETGDFLGRGRDLALGEGDLIAVMSAGAYGMSMSSNYNSRPRAAEVMVDGSSMHLVRGRETIPDLYRDERLLP